MCPLLSREKQGQATVKGEWLRVGVRTHLHTLGFIMFGCSGFPTYCAACVRATLAVRDHAPHSESQTNKKHRVVPSAFSGAW